MNKQVFTLLILLSFMFIIPLAYGGEPENLLGISLNFDKKEITIKVVSSGCTQKSDFSFLVKDNTITVIRNKRDECKAEPEEISLTYSLKEAGIDPNKPFLILNKFIVNLNIANI